MGPRVERSPDDVGRNMINVTRQARCDVVRDAARLLALAECVQRLT